MNLRRRALIGILAALLTASIAHPSAAQEAPPEEFFEEGRARENSVLAGRATYNEFLTTCPSAPTSQGKDGWLFSPLPDNFLTGEWYAELSSPDAELLYDLDMYFFDDSCKKLKPKVGTSDADAVEGSPLPAGTRYVFGEAYLGAPLTMHLRITPIPEAPTWTPPTPTDPCVLPTEGAAPASSEPVWPTEMEIKSVGSRSHYALAASTPSNFYAGGFYDGLQTSFDGGGTWATQPGPRSIRAIEFADETHGWAAGGQNVMYLTRDGGASWSECRFTNRTSLVILDIDFVDRSQGWMVGKTFGNPEAPLIFVTADGGSTWTEQNPATSRAVLIDVEFTDALTGYAVGAGLSIRTTDGGATWVPMEISSNVHGIVATPDGLVAAAFFGGIYRSTDSGVSWTQIARLPCCPTSLSYEGGALFVSGLDGLLASSFNGGSAWRKESIGDLSLDEVVALGPTRAVAAGDGGSIVRFEAQPPAPSAPQTTYYLDSQNGAGIFSERFPSGNEDEIAFDGPLSNSRPEQAFDPTWRGTIDGTIDRMDLRFWQRSIEDVWSYEYYELVVWVGEGAAAEMTTFEFTASSPPGSEPAEVTVPIEGIGIDPAGRPVTIALRDYFDASAIYYGSEVHPSGFTVNAPAPVRLICEDAPDLVTPVVDDPCLGKQWGLEMIRAPQAWQEPQATGRGIITAPIDTGLDLGHPDFACPGKVIEIPDGDVVRDGNGTQDGHGHGTHVGGIIGACTNNGEGVAGVAPGAAIMPIQFFDRYGDSSDDSDDNGEEDLADSIRIAADNGAHVINMSLGYSIGQLPGTSLIGPVFQELVPEIDEAIEYAASKGVVVVASSGNTSSPICGFPALAEDVICVTSLGPDEARADYSSFGMKLDEEGVTGPAVAAPGGAGGVCQDDVLSTWARTVESECEGQGYEAIAGTSMASPHVAGVAALVYERLGAERSEANGHAVIDAITGSAKDLGAPGYDPVYGYGRVDALDAVRAVTPVAPPVAETSLNFTAESASSARYSDAATVELVLQQTSGEPVAGAPVNISLDGYSYDAVTDATGHAAISFPVLSTPGSYELAATYGGDAGLAPSETAAPFTVHKEVTQLTVSARGPKLTAQLVDDDGSSVAEREVVFYSSGIEIGRAFTDASGVATHDRTPCSRGGCSFTASFAGDDYYEGSSG